MNKDIYKHAIEEIWKLIRFERFVTFNSKEDYRIHNLVNINVIYKICDNPELCDDILKNPDKYIDFKRLLGEKTAINYGYIKDKENEN